jgi:hypothetical protein
MILVASSADFQACKKLPYRSKRSSNGLSAMFQNHVAESLGAGQNVSHFVPLMSSFT